MCSFSIMALFYTNISAFCTAVQIRIRLIRQYFDFKIRHADFYGRIEKISYVNESPYEFRTYGRTYGRT